MNNHKKRVYDWSLAFSSNKLILLQHIYDNVVVLNILLLSSSSFMYNEYYNTHKVLFILIPSFTIIKTYLMNRIAISVWRKSSMQNGVQ